ncbi:hypothetical protein EDB19DRAFT_1914756 [Suillus lakei]|nr:hypothetical protein EDB19DRAFT_1914756 [Suillus lakei]
MSSFVPDHFDDHHSSSLSGVQQVVITAIRATDALQREALALLPVGHTDRSKSLNNLANRLSTCFDHRGNDEDLDQAIALHGEVGSMAYHTLSHVT